MVSYLKHYFSVNTAEKVVVKQSEWKITVAQYEQDATCLVFDMPRYIDGHDMLACNAKEVHYTTTRGGLGVYEIVDAALKKGSDKIITFSWYLSGVATENVGPLSFVIRFAEIENSNPTNILFDWYTLSNDKDIEITAGMNNGEPVIEPHVDILNQWRMALLADTIISLKQVKTSTESLGENIWEATFKDGRKEQLVIRNGAAGHTPEAGVDYYTPEEIEEIKLELQEYIDEVVSQTEFEGGAGEITGNNNEIFNVYEDVTIGNWVLVKNQAIGIATHAEGAGTIAGCKAFIIKGSRNVELDAPIDGTIPESNVIGIYTLDSVNGIEIGDEYSIKYSSNYDFNGSVIAVWPDTSEYFTLEENEIATYGAVINDPGYDYTDDGEPELWFPYKPTIGTTAWGIGQHAEGENTKAVSSHAHAEGLDTVAAGRYGHAEGKETLAVYCSHAEGRGTQSLGEISHAEGDRTIAKGFAAHSEGNKTQAIGSQSHAGGNKSVARGSSSFAHGVSCESNGTASFTTGTGTKATSMNQFVAGSYNDIRDDAAFIVGNGSKDSSRSNAFVVMKDGSAEVSKQGTSANSIVIRDTLNKVVEYCGIQEIKTTDNVLAVDPTISVSEEFLISASNSGEIKKFGTNLLKTNKTYDAYGIVTKLDPYEPSGIIISGTAKRKLTEVQAANYSIYLPVGHYTFFIEGLDSKHSSDNVYFRLLGTNAAGEEAELARTNSVRSMVEFDISEDITEAISKIKIKTVIQTGESFTDEHIKFQLQVGGKTEFDSYKKPTSIELVAGEETIIVVDDLTPFTLVSQTEGNTITCKYPVSTKSYIDKKIGAIESSLDEIIKIQEDLITPNGDEVSY